MGRGLEHKEKRWPHAEALAAGGRDRIHREGVTTMGGVTEQANCGHGNQVWWALGTELGLRARGGQSQSHSEEGGIVRESFAW